MSYKGQYTESSIYPYGFAISVNMVDEKNGDDKAVS